METIRVWTKQHIAVWDALQRNGFYHAHFEGIRHDEDARLMMEAYRWLAANIPNIRTRPLGAECPIWLAFSKARTMLPSPNTVLMELEVHPHLITHINIAKWGTILNCNYIPCGAEDAQRHRQLMQTYGVSDVEACITQFYPQLKQEIQQSWLRLFDDSIQVGNTESYGTIWEIRREWVRCTEIL